MLEGLATNRFLREGSAKADLGAETALLEHDPQLAALGRLLAQRGWIYVRFLSELAKLFVRIARAVESLHHEALQGDAPPSPRQMREKAYAQANSRCLPTTTPGRRSPPNPSCPARVWAPLAFPLGTGRALLYPPQDLFGNPSILHRDLVDSRARPSWSFGSSSRSDTALVLARPLIAPPWALLTGELQQERGCTTSWPPPGGYFLPGRRTARSLAGGPPPDVLLFGTLRWPIPSRPWTRRSGGILMNTRRRSAESFSSGTLPVRPSTLELKPSR